MIFTDNTLPFVIKREVVNIDDPIDIDWAEFLIQRAKAETTGAVTHVC